MTTSLQSDSQSTAQLIESQEPGWSLAQRFYTDPDIYALELERIITRNWILAGHESQLPEPGDFKVINVANESAIIVRSADGCIKAFANVCRHRGSLVCLESHGNTRKFECPYHGWTYDTDGNLVAARHRWKSSRSTKYAQRLRQRVLFTEQSVCRRCVWSAVCLLYGFTPVARRRQERVGGIHGDV